MCKERIPFAHNPERHVSNPVTDITIAGAGPSGLALAARLASAGARVVVVDPAPDAPWPNRYGAWVQDLDSVPIERTWHAPEVALDGSGRTPLSGSYAWIDRTALRARLRDELLGHGGRLLTGRVVGTTVTSGALEAHLADGTTLTSRRLVDATGRGSLVARDRAPRAFQVALGQVLRVSEHPFRLDQAVFMDFRTAHLGPGAAGPPTFLYALPLDDEHVFVEETCLATTAPLRLTASAAASSRTFRSFDAAADPLWKSALPAASTSSMTVPSSVIRT